MAKIHDKYIIELAEVIKGFGNDPNVKDPFELSLFYRFYELPNIAIQRENFQKMKPFDSLCKTSWSGLWSEPTDDNSVYGEKLMEGDTIYLLGVEGMVTFENGAWGWGSSEYVPWEQLESKIPHGNNPSFCYCDNFVSFWELKWNFDDGNDWDGVPYISHERT